MAVWFQKKPIPVLAIHWTGDNADEVNEFTGDRFEAEEGTAMLLAGKGGAQEWVPVPDGDWIFTDGSGGNFWPVDPAYLAANYDEVDPPEGC